MAKPAQKKWQEVLSIDNDKPLLEAKEIYKTYGSLEVLKGVSLSLQAGEVVALRGSSGAGKSTLLHILGELDKPDRGEIWFKGTNLVNLPDKAAAHFRNQYLGYVFQFHHLLPEFTAVENVSMPALIAGKSPRETQQRATELLGHLGLAQRAAHKPSALSGGEQQRVAVARALINDPLLILADEPTGNLDSVNSQELMDLIVQLARERQVSFLIATHDLTLAKRADRRLEIRDGRIPQQP